MAWIPLYHELREHPKALRAADDLEMELPALIGHLAMLWAWCMHYACEGDITKFRPTEIAKAALYPGDAEWFVEVLVKHRILDREGDLLIVHKWIEYGGKYNEKRKSDAARKKARIAAAASGDTPSAGKDAEGLRNSDGTDAERTRTSAGTDAESLRTADGKDADGSGREEYIRKEEKREEYITPARRAEQLDIESPLAMEVRRVCAKNFIQLSQKDRTRLQLVLDTFHTEGIGIEQLQEFERAWPSFWMGKKGQVPRFSQLIELWGPVLKSAALNNGDLNHGNSNSGFRGAAAEAAARYAAEHAGSLLAAGSSGGDASSADAGPAECRDG